MPVQHILNPSPAQRHGIDRVLRAFDVGMLLIDVSGIGVVGGLEFELPPLIVGVGRLPGDFVVLRTEANLESLGA